MTIWRCIEQKVIMNLHNESLITSNSDNKVLKRITKLFFPDFNARIEGLESRVMKLLRELSIYFPVSSANATLATLLESIWWNALWGCKLPTDSLQTPWNKKRITIVFAEIKFLKGFNIYEVDGNVRFFLECDDIIKIIMRGSVFY